MERPLSPVPLARVGGGSRRLAILVALAAVLVAAAVAKPWAGPAGSSPELATPLLRVAAPGPRVAVNPGPLPGVSGATPGRPCCHTGAPAGPVEADGMPICYTPDGWRVVADTEENGTRSRIWLPVDAVAAGRPGDPEVPVARLTATRIVALGFCAPAGGPPVGARTAILWSDLPAAASAGNRYVRVAALRAAAQAGGALADAAPGRATWPPGRYVVQVPDGAPGTGSAWFGLVLTAPAS